MFQRPFSRGLFLAGLIFGGAYLRREICVSKLIGLALYLEGDLPFLPCFTLHLKGGGGGRGDLTEGFLGYECGGLIFGGAYFRNFRVSVPCHSCQYCCPFLCFKTAVFYLAFIILSYFIYQHLPIVLLDIIIRL